MSQGVLFRNARVFDGEHHDLRDGLDVFTMDGTIARISEPFSQTDNEVDIIDCSGRLLMPGLIDAHVHVYVASLNIGRIAQTPVSYLAHFAAHFLHSSLDRGFTTLRDVGGGDVGLASALKAGLLGLTPTLFYGGRMLSQTGGHGDLRPGDHAFEDVCNCGCACHANVISVIADGVDAVRRAVREELRRGASHIKIMASGGVASPTDPLERCQYSDEEIKAAVDEAERAGSYVAAHCHPASAIRRSATLGVRSIEHGTLIDRETAEFVAERRAFIVPTMAIISGLTEEGDKFGFPAVSMDKLRGIADRALGSLEIIKRAGIRMGFGTDLLGDLHIRQSTEFSLRAQVLPAIDILRSATSVNAEILGQSGRLGCIREGAAADLLVVNGNPLEDISLLAEGGEHMAVIMKGGQFHKRTI